MHDIYPTHQPEASRISWLLASNRFYEDETGRYLFADDQSESIDRLPVEFFSHQLVETDWSEANDADLLAFTSEYGLPFHPMRYVRPSAQWAIPSDVGYSDGLAARLLAVDKTDKHDPGKPIEELIRDISQGKNESGMRSVVSLDEARFALIDLRCAVEEMFVYLRTKTPSWPKVDESFVGFVKNMPKGGTTFWRDVDFVKIGTTNCWQEVGIINAGATNARILTDGRTDSILPCYNLTNAICNQVVDTVADETPWKLCECKGCGRIYKHKQPKSGFFKKTGKNPSRSKYCCEKCEKRQTKRNQREAAKNRIQH